MEIFAGQFIRGLIIHQKSINGVVLYFWEDKDFTYSKNAKNHPPGLQFRRYGKSAGMLTEQMKDWIKIVVKIMNKNPSIQSKWQG